MNYVFHEIANYYLVLFYWKKCVCGFTIFLPIGEKIVLIYGILAIILVSSSSIGDLLPCSLIFLEEYYALLNELFFAVVVGHP